MLVSPQRDRVAERREATRLEILDAAWALARSEGLTQLTLRDVAAAVGMRAPSLYTHFESKMAIYDAMFGQAWGEYETSGLALEPSLSEHPRTAVKQLARHFFDYASADLARHQLMNQRIVPGFEPSAEAYAPAVRVLEHGAEQIRSRGDISDQDFEIWIAIIGGLINQHHANDPGGTRYAGLLARAVDMWADAVGLPHEGRAPSRKARR